jgi:hypothetical protein
MKRVDAAIVQLVVVEYDADGRPIGEQLTQAMKMFAGAIPDLPATIAKLNAEFADTKADG